MKRILQSALAVVLLFALTLLAIVNTVQLHNTESRLAAIEKKLDGGVPTRAAGPTTAATTPNAERCDADVPTGEGNLLRPFRFPEGVAPGAGGTLRRIAGQDPPGLNFYASPNAADVSDLYRYVAVPPAIQSWDNPDEWYSGSATRITSSADHLVYDVYLRKGIKWQKPAVKLDDPRYAWLNAEHELVADDFQFALEVIRNPKVTGRAAALRPYFEQLDRFEVVDDHHYRMHFKKDQVMHETMVFDLTPYPRWLYGSDEDGHPYDEATLGEKLNTHWYNQGMIGVGPYRFVRWEPGVVVELEANPMWVGCTKATFDAVQVKLLKDQQSWLRYLKNKELDYTQVMPAQYLAEIKGKEPYLGDPGIKLSMQQESSYFYIGWNQQKPLFRDKRVRTALAYAFNGKALLDTVFAGLGDLTSGPFDRNTPWYDKDIAPLPHDLAKARALLAEAGWADSDKDGVLDQQIDGKKVDFIFTLLMYGGSTEYESMGRVYREDLLSIGVKMTPQPLEWPAQLQKMKERDFDAYTGSWVPTWDVDLRQIWHSSQADAPGSSNYVAFKNAEADQIIDAFATERDHAKRVAMAHRFHALVAEEQPYAFFYQRVRPVLYWDTMTDPVWSRIYPQRDLRLMSFKRTP